MKIAAAVATAVIAALSFSACGGDELVTESPPAAEPTTQDTPESFETAPAGKTACAAFAGVASERCVLSYQLCSVVTPAAVAEEYGGDPAIPEDVARVYGESYIPAARQFAIVGCEAGFASQDENG
jgi:hypothetical protein